MHTLAAAWRTPSAVSNVKTTRAHAAREELVLNSAEEVKDEDEDEEEEDEDEWNGRAAARTMSVPITTQG